MQGGNARSATGRIAVIETMRGAAAISVALFHFGSQLDGPVPQFFHKTGWTGVDVFFVISGFVIPLSLLGQDYRIGEFPRFMLRRLIRLEPPYLASIALVVVLGYLASLAPGYRGQPPDYSAAQVALHFFYLIPLTSYAWVNPVYWSLAYEFVFYISMGLLYVPLVLRHPGWTLGFAALIGALLFWRTGHVEARVAEFLLGLLTMRIMFAQGPAAVLWASWLLSAAVIFWAGGLLAGAAATAAALIILLFRDVSSIWGARAGALSYSLYLIHVPVGGKFINLAGRFGSGWMFDLAVMAAALVLSLAAAWLFSRAFEAPAIAQSRRLQMAAPYKGA